MAMLFEIRGKNNNNNKLIEKKKFELNKSRIFGQREKISLRQVQKLEIYLYGVNKSKLNL